MEKKEKIELPKDAFAVISYALFDYKRLLAETVKNCPEDETLKEVYGNFGFALEEFRKKLDGEIKPAANSNAEILIAVLEMLCDSSKLSIFAALSAYIDILNETLSENEPESSDANFLDFYDLLMETFNYIAAVFTNLEDCGYSYRNLVTDLISDGLARRPEHKVIYDSMQEILCSVKSGKEFSSDFVTEFYGSLNPLEKEFFASDMLPDYVNHTEDVLASENDFSENQVSGMENSLVAAKQMFRCIGIYNEKKQKK